MNLEHIDTQLHTGAVPSLLRLLSTPRIRAMRRVESGATTEAIISCAMSGTRPKIKPLQVASELSQLIERVRALKPRRVVEIGTARGGTLFAWSRVADPAALLVSIDLPGGKFGGGSSRARVPLFSALPLPGQRLHLLRGDSHANETQAHLKTILAGEPIDFLFIDGDHTYQGAKHDFDAYAPLVRPGGLIALHDVADHFADACDVQRLWAELKPRYAHAEFIADEKQGWAGIGVIET